MQRRPVRFAIAFVALAVLGLLFAFRAPIFRAIVAAAIDGLTGYRVAFDDLLVSRSNIAARGLHVEAGGEPLLDADRLDIAYTASDVFGGAARGFGLHGVRLERPHFQVIRHADGSFNLPSGSAPSGGGGASPASGSASRFAFDAAVRDGTLTIVDPNRVLRIARRIEIVEMNGSATIDTAARSSYRVRGRLTTAPSQPFDLRGRFDADGFALHHLRAAVVSIVPIADYFINTPSAEMADGIARNLDLRLYSLGPGPDGSTHYHIGGSGDVDGGTMHLPGFVHPATRMRGRIDIYDDGLVTRDMRARLGAVDVRLEGGLFDVNDPQFRLGVVADRAPLRDVRDLFTFSQALPIEGDARVTTLLENQVGTPLVVVCARAPHVAYGSFPIDDVSARAVFYQSAIDIVGAHGSYGGLGTGTNGVVVLGDTVQSQFVVDATGPAARVPYAAQIAPLAQLHATGLIHGDGTAFDARGVASGRGGGADLSGTFEVDPHGDGSFGPLVVAERGGGSAMGAFYLNRSESESGFWLDAHDYPFARIPADPHLPGLALAPPVFGARIDGAVAGIGPPSDFRVAGTARGRAVDVGGVAIDAVDGNFAGRLANLRLGGVAAHGPWGDFRGTGAYAASALALAGTYHGSFTELRTITGDIGANGPVNGPVDLLLSPERTVVQARGDESRGATVHGVPVDELAGTLSVAGKQLRIYAATASVAGGTFAAAGYANGARGVGVTVADVDARRLRAIAPLDAGHVDAIGNLRGEGTTTRFDGGLALGEATLDRLPIAGNGDLTLSGSRLQVRTTDARLGEALGSLDGSLDRLGSGTPRYDLNLHVPGAQVEPIARIFAPDRSDIAGTLAADLRVSGTPADLRVDGSVRVPEGTVNGLSFRDAAAGLAVTRDGLLVRDGAVTVGSTRADFGAAFGGRDAAMHVHAPNADLADFNDYFDDGDTLGGRGHVAVNFEKRGDSVRSTADVAIAHLEYRRFDLGDATANWTSHGPDVKGKLAFGGESGRLQMAGTYVVAANAPLEKFFERSRFDGTAQLRGLDLGVWLPALGYQLPVGGRVDADATIAGPLRNPSVDTTFTLVGGSLWRFPVDRLEVSAVSTLRRTTITRATVNLPSVEMTGAGSFGLGPNDPVAFALHAKSPDVGTVALRVAGSSLALAGAAEADVKVDGTRAKPRVSGGFDLENATLHGVAIPQALGEFSIAGRDLVLSDAEVGLAKGTLYLAGSVPLVIAPFGFGPSSAPITLDFDAKGIDLANFAPLLPNGSTLTGTLDGHVAVGGTAGDPRLDGKLALAGGAFRGPFETVPLDSIGAQVTFSGSTASLDLLHAAAGGGTIDASGKMTFANLVHPGADADYHFAARATHLRLDLPAYGGGQIDGTLSVAHAREDHPLLAGSLALSDATIPFSALLFADQGSGGFETTPASTTTVAPAPPSDVALALDLSAQHNVRVRSGNVDIGATGTLHVSGTTSAPSLAGSFDSTGGTITYFNTVFRLLDGEVSFQPDLGVIPNLNAHAIAHVINPDPNTVRNATGSADVTLALKGPVTSLSITLSSDPAYDREQILGLLLSAPALGATNLFATTGQPTLYGTTQTNLPAGASVPRSTNGEFSVAQEAFGVANAQFTRVLLSPIETSVAEAVGLTNINVNVDYLGNVGLTARKILGKNVNAIYGASFGYPYRQTVGFELKPNEVTAAQVTVFQTLGAYGLNSLTPYYLTPNNLKIQAAQPNLGTTGFSLSLQRLF